MDAGDYVNTQLITVIRETLSNYCHVILKVQLYY